MGGKFLEKWFSRKKSKIKLKGVEERTDRVREKQVRKKSKKN